MQVASQNDVVYSTAVRCIDSGNHIILNSVPYDKKTNSPVPFNNVSISLKDPYQTIGKKGMNVYSHVSDVSYVTYNYLDTKFETSIIDNQNPNICYTVCCKKNENVKSDSILENKNTESERLVICKLITNSDNSITKEECRHIFGSTYNYQCISLTQDNNNLYLLLQNNFSTNSGSSSSNANFICNQYVYVLAISKNFEVKELRHINLHYLNYEANSKKVYLNGQNVDGYTRDNNATVVKVVYTTNEGILFYVDGLFCNASNQGSSQYINYNTRYIWYSYITKEFEHINVSENVQIFPFGLPTVIGSSSGTINSSNLRHTAKAIPSKYKELSDKVYGYFYGLSHDKSSYNQVYENNVWQLFYIDHLKSDLLTANIKTIDLVFPDESDYEYNPEYEIYDLPKTTTVIGNTPYKLNDYLTRTSYETFFSTHNDIDYVHIVYKGSYQQNTEHGIYTFEVNTDKTKAQFVSFYPALGGTLCEFLPLKDDYSKICLATLTSYHFLTFDPVSKKWVSTFDALNRMKSCILTDENKVYALLNDDSIVCHDLNGAVVIDFNFEKQSYNYNNADIDSYISIWAKDSDNQYVAADIKLTIVGNCVWKSNGLQTLETKTSASGPLNIPFTIKGQTSINVGVDAII